MSDPQDQGKALAFDILDGILRSWWTVVAGGCLGVAAALIVVQYAPRVYEAQVRIHAESERLPDEFVTDLVTNDARFRINSLLGEVLDGDHLAERARETFAVGLSPAEQEDVLATIRSNVQLLYSKREKTMDIRFRDADPVRAAEVANHLGDLVVEANKEFRQKRAGTNLQVLEQLADDAAAMLKAKQDEIAEFRARYRNELPELLEQNMSALEARKSDLSVNLEAQSDLRQTIQNHEAQRSFAERPGVESSGTGTVTSETMPAGDLAELRAEEKRLLRRYAPSHPDVIAIQRQIEEIERRAATSPAPPPGPEEQPETEPQRPAPMFDAAAIRARGLEGNLRKLEEEESGIRADIARYQRRIDSTPTVRRQMEEMSGGLDVLIRKHNDRLSDVSDAQGAVVVEGEALGAQFEVIAWAPPRAPLVFPKPILVLGTCVSLGLVLFVAPIVARRFFSPIVRSESRLMSVAEIPVLVTIPAIPTPERAQRRKRQHILNFTLAAFSILAVAVVMVLKMMGLL